MKNIIRADYIKAFNEKTIKTKKPLEDVVNALVAKYSNKDLYVKWEKDKDETYVVIIQKKGMFTSVPGLKTFMYAKMSDQEDSVKAEAGILIETDSGIQTSLLMQSLIKSSVFIDPVPLPMLPRYDKIIFSVFHKAIIDRNIGIAVRTGLCDEILKDIGECSKAAGNI